MKNRFIALFTLCFVLIACIVSCDVSTTTNGTVADQQSTINIANKLQHNQPTPTDIDYSLERYNLIRRAYWVNGQREKAAAVPCPVEKPLGYVTLFIEGVGVAGSFVVDGKVSSLNSFLTPDSEYYEQEYGNNGYSVGDGNSWLADVDGSYGENDSGIFFFTADGNYMEWTGPYLYTDIPFVVNDPILRVEGTN